MNHRIVVLLVWSFQMYGSDGTPTNQPLSAPETLESLLGLTQEFELKNQEVYNYLCHQAFRGDCALLRTAATCGLDLSVIKSSKGCGLVHYAALGNHAHVLRYLAQEGVSLAPPSELLQNSAELLILDKEIPTPLHIVAKEGSWQALKVLLDCPAVKNPNYLNQSIYSMTPLMIAASNRHVECVRLLLNARASIYVSSDSSPVLSHIENEHKRLNRSCNPCIRVGNWWRGGTGYQEIINLLGQESARIQSDGKKKDR